MESAKINYDIFANAAKNSVEFGGNVMGKAFQSMASIANPRIAGYADMMEHLSKTKLAGPAVDDSVPVTPASLGVTDKVLGMFYRHAVTAAMGSFPTHNNMQIVHLNEGMCEQLVANTRVYDSVRCGDNAFVWDTRKVRSGDIVGRMHTESFAKTGCTVDEINTGVSISFAGIGGITLGARTMIVFGDNVLMSGPKASVEVAVGGMRVRLQPGYTHYGVSVPSEYLHRVILHTRGLSAVYCHFQTGGIDKSYGNMAGHRNVDVLAPSMRFTHVVAPDIDYARVPDFSPMYKIRWSGNTQSVLTFKNVQFLNLSTVSLLLDAPIDFNVLVPSRRASTVSYFAAVAYSDRSLPDDDYIKICNSLDAGRSWFTVDNVCRAADQTELEFYSKQRLTTEEHHVNSFEIHTYESSVVTTYKVVPAGIFRPGDLSTDEHTVGSDKYEILGRSRL